MEKKEMNINALRERIRLRCKKLHITHKQLAEKAGVNINTINSWLRQSEDDYGKRKNNIPHIDHLYRVAVALGVSLDYITGRDDFTNIGNKEMSAFSGLSDSAIEMLRKINDSENPFYEINRFNIDMLDTILSDYYNKLIKGKSKQKTYRTIFRYMWDYIHASDYVAETGDSLNENILVTNKNDTSDEPLSQLIPVKSLVPHYMKNEIMKCLDSL